MEKNRERLNDLCTTAAVAIGATEMAAFAVDERHVPARLKTLVHIRPGVVDEGTLAAAIAAFKGLTAPCVEQGRSGMIEIAPADEAGRAQFCLVTVAIRGSYVVGAAAFIVRLAATDDGRASLARIAAVHDGF